MKKSLRIEAIHPGYVAELFELDKYFAADHSGLEQKLMSDSYNDDDAEGEKPYSIIDGIGVYKISGPIMQAGTWLTRYFGYADYEGIRNDLIAMGADPAVQEILILMASPGGTVFGVTNAAEAIARVGKVKDVYVYTGSNCCSGAYWLAAPAKEIIAAPEAQVGSIGVIVTHVSYEKQIEEDGVKVTVIKSDELKAVGGPYKDLTEKEVAHIQARVDTYSDMFHDHVQKNRPQVRLSSMKGQEFVGQDALQYGLIDAVMSYDDAIDHIKSQRQTTQTGGYTTMKMTAETLRAALEAGQTLADLGLTEEESEQILAEQAVPEGEGEQALAPEGAGENAEGSEGEDLAAPELEALAAKLAEAEARATVAEAALETAKAEAESMRGIVVEVFNNRRVALGLAKLDVEAMSLTTLLSDYQATTEQFKKSFKIGGSLKPEATKPPPSAIQDSVHASLLQAAATR